MPHITTCSRCGELYEESSEEEANNPTRLCLECFHGPAPAEEECDYCDGCGWTEGGKALQTGCPKCGGTGRVPAR